MLGIRRLSSLFRTAALSCCPLRSAPLQRFQSTGRWWSRPRGFRYLSQSHPRSQPLPTVLLYRGRRRQRLWGCTCKESQHVEYDLEDASQHTVLKLYVNGTLPEFVSPVKLVHHRRLPVPSHDHLLLLQLLCYLRYNRVNRRMLTECNAGVLSKDRGTNSHLWQKILTLRSTSWRKRRTSPAWKRCRSPHELDHPEQNQMTQGVKGSSINRPLDRRGLVRHWWRPITEDTRQAPQTSSWSFNHVNDAGKRWRHLQTRFPEDWPGSYRWTLLKAFVRWRKDWRPVRTAEWWGYWMCRTVWWGKCCTGRGSVPTWWEGPLWSPGEVGKSLIRKYLAQANKITWFLGLYLQLSVLKKTV